MSIGRTAKDLFYYGVNPYLLQFTNRLKDEAAVKYPLVYDFYDNLRNNYLNRINQANSKIGRYPYMYPYIKE